MQPQPVYAVNCIKHRGHIAKSGAEEATADQGRLAMTEEGQIIEAGPAKLSLLLGLGS